MEAVAELEAVAEKERERAVGGGGWDMGWSGAGGEGEEEECWWLAAAGDTGMGDAQQKGCMKKRRK